LSHSVRGIRKKMVAGIALAGIATSGLAISTASATQSVTQDRVAGTNRYGTAAAIASATFTGTRQDIVIASGESFPDGLAASALAGLVDSPVLLTGKDSLPAETVLTLGSLSGGAKRLHIMGGEAAISKAVRDQLKGLGYTLVENYNGTNRYDTAAKIATAVGGTNIGGFGGKRTAIIATGAGFADALAASGPAFRGKHPILLTPKDTLAPETAAAITALGVQQVIVMGGDAAVAPAVKTALTTQLGAGNVVTIAGTDRADTAVKLADIVTTSSNGFGFGKGTVVLFNGFDGFADGLAAGPHAGKIGAVLLPVQKDSIPAATAKYHVDNAASISTVRIIGGTAAISQTVADGAKAAATIAGPTATIAATAGASSFTVTFSAAVDSADLVAAGNTLAGLVSIASSTAANAGSGARVATYNATTRVLTVTTAAPLVGGDVISLVTNPAGSGLTTINALGSTTVFVPVPTAFTVAADAVKPSATILGKVNAGGTTSSLVLVFSEPTTGLLPAEVVVAARTTGPAAPTVTGLAFATDGLSASATLSGQLINGDTISIAAGLFSDLSGNTSNAASGVVATDSILPVLVSAKSVLVNTNTDSFTTGTLVVSGKATGNTLESLNIVPGAAGSATVVTYTPGATASLVITADLAANTATTIAAAINANAAASAVLVATGGATPLAGGGGTRVGADGTTTSNVTVTFSEGVTAATVRWDLDGNLATTGDQITPALPVPGAVLEVSGAAATIVPGVAKAILDGATDAVGNLASPTGVVVTVI
jgi:putative cell wall-binding protein